VCVCVCVSQFVSERSAIFLVLHSNQTDQGNERRVWRGRDRDGEIWRDMERDRPEREGVITLIIV
jgi:hypothetical protein